MKRSDDRKAVYHVPSPEDFFIEDKISTSLNGMDYIKSINSKEAAKTAAIRTKGDSGCRCQKGRYLGLVP